MARKKSKTREFEVQLAQAKKDQGKYLLKLYVSGATARSLRAIETIKRICEEQLAGRYELEVIDVYQDPQRVSDDQIIAAPTLVKNLPPPMRRLIGDLSSEEKVLVGLDIVKR